MKKAPSILFICCLLLLSCDHMETVYSPDGKKSLTFIYREDLSTTPNDLFIYNGEPPVDKSQYIRLGWTNHFGVTVIWGNDPIKIRTVTLIHQNTIPTHVIDVQKYPLEDSMADVNDSFVSYDLPQLMDGKYRKENPKP